ncbi:MAG: type II secretion system protein [Planctomycetota bacterium]|nr:type II secretion system protein [Planctomycetota bacterium]
MRPTRGFTLIELLVVIGIIGVLAALLMPALNMLRNKQKSVATQKLMQSVGFALDQYISSYAILGDDATRKGDAFRADPLTYLVTNPREPYLELKQIQMDGNTLLDAWIQPIHFMIDNRGMAAATSGTFVYTARVQMVSGGANDGKKTDDIVYGLDVSEGRWKNESVIDYNTDFSYTP